MVYFVFLVDGDHRDLHVLTHSVPTRRSSDLVVEPGARRRLAGWQKLRLAGPGGEEARLGRLREGRQLRRKARSEEHTSELQSLMRTSYAVFCLKNQTTQTCSNQTRRHYGNCSSSS